MILLLVFLAACVAGADLLPVALPSLDPPTSGCRVVRVVHGDTVDLSCPGQGRLRSRLVGFDTPEITSPRCRAEAQLGDQAKRRLQQLVGQSQQTEARFRGLDRYKRHLVILRLDGRNVSDTLVSEGLAVRYSGGQRIDWCRKLGAA